MQNEEPQGTKDPTWPPVSTGASEPETNQIRRPPAIPVAATVVTTALAGTAAGCCLAVLVIVSFSNALTPSLGRPVANLVLGLLSIPIESAAALPITRNRARARWLLIASAATSSALVTVFFAFAAVFGDISWRNAASDQRDAVGRCSPTRQRAGRVGLTLWLVMERLFGLGGGGPPHFHPYGCIAAHGD